MAGQQAFANPVAADHWGHLELRKESAHGLTSAMECQPGGGRQAKDSVSADGLAGS